MKSEAQGLGQKTGSWKLTMIFNHKGFDPWPGRIPHAAEQLSLCTTATEPCSGATASETRVPRARTRQQERPEPPLERSPRSPELERGQPNKYRSHHRPQTAFAKTQRKDLAFSSMSPKGESSRSPSSRERPLTLTATLWATCPSMCHQSPLSVP